MTRTTPTAQAPPPLPLASFLPPAAPSLALPQLPPSPLAKAKSPATRTNPAQLCPLPPLLAAACPLATPAAHPPSLPSPRPLLLATTRRTVTVKRANLLSPVSHRPPPALQSSLLPPAPLSHPPLLPTPLLSRKSLALSPRAMARPHPQPPSPLLLPAPLLRRSLAPNRKATSLPHPLLPCLLPQPAPQSSLPQPAAPFLQPPPVPPWPLPPPLVRHLLKRSLALKTKATSLDPQLLLFLLLQLAPPSSPLLPSHRLPPAPLLKRSHAPRTRGLLFPLPAVLFHLLLLKRSLALKRRVFLPHLLPPPSRLLHLVSLADLTVLHKQTSS